MTYDMIFVQGRKSYRHWRQGQAKIKSVPSIQRSSRATVDSVITLTHQSNLGRLNVDDSAMHREAVP